MPRTRAATPAVVAQRLSDLLLQFPSAVKGVRWSVLAKKYQERYGSPIDLKSFGFDSPLTAAPALLWDVAKVMTRDQQDPVLALEAGVALAAKPGCAGTWPSLYASLCQVVREHGEEVGTHRSLLMSQLKPLLQSHWHSRVDESWSYLDANGTVGKTKKLKHLVNCVIDWKDKYGDVKALDKHLALHLTLAKSDKHNDLMLSCRDQPEAASSDSLPEQPVIYKNLLQDEEQTEQTPFSAGAALDCHMRSKKSWADTMDEDDEAQNCVDTAATQPQADIAEEADKCCGCDLDDPFEPPLRSRWESTPTTLCSTPAGFSMASGSSTPSVHAPMTAMAGFGYVPMFFSSVCSIPTGTVDRLRKSIESGLGANASPLVPPQNYWR